MLSSSLFTNYTFHMFLNRLEVNSHTSQIVSIKDSCIIYRYSMKTEDFAQRFNRHFTNLAHTEALPHTANSPYGILTTDLLFISLF